MSHRRRILPLIVLLPVLLGACLAWQPVTVPPAQYVIDEAPERVRLTTMDGARMTIEGPIVRAGAVVGTRSAGAALLDDIRTLEVEETSVLRTVLLVTPGVALVALVALATCRC